jgi:putative transposase
MASPRLRYGRYSRSGNVYSLTTATLGREPLFADAANVAILIDTLRFVERKGFSHSLAWVVMPDHLHWLMELHGGTLAECMALLKSRSSRLLNRRLERQGPLWQHGYHDHAVRSDESLHEKAMYILAIRSVRAWPARWVSTHTHGAVGRCRCRHPDVEHPRMAWIKLHMKPSRPTVICRNHSGRRAGA